MSALQSPPAPARARSRAARPLAVATAAAFAAEAVVAAVWPANISDHSAGAGRASEALAGLAFLLAAATLLAWVPVLGRWLAAPAVLGCAAMGVAQLDIAARGQEWPDMVVNAILLVAVTGLPLAGVAGVRAGAWPWWIALLLALVVPVLFVVPSPGNSAVLALVWVVVAARGPR